jgi:preprotein translocase subunit YajC
MRDKVMESTNFFYTAQAGNPGMMNLMMIVFLFAGMWFLIIAPQRKKQKEQQKMINALGSGDKIVTVGGIFGIVQSVKDDRVVLKIAEGTKVEVRKSAVEACLNKDNDKK